MFQNHYTFTAILFTFIAAVIVISYWAKYSRVLKLVKFPHSISLFSLFPGTYLVLFGDASVCLRYEK